MNSQTEEKLHSPYSPSSAKRWFNCALSIRLIQVAPKPPEHPSAKEGTLTHECLEIFNKSDRHPALVAKQLLQDGHPMMRVSRARIAHEQIQKIRAKFPGADFYAERKVDTSHFIGPGEKGTVDASIVELFGTLTVIDYKNGVMPVDPEENEQGIAYALAIAKEHDYNFEQVDITIIQPNSRVAYKTISTWSTTMKELRKWEKIFRKKVKATLSPNAKAVVGEYCFFCPAKNFNCPAHKEKWDSKAVEAFDEMDMW